MISSTTLRYSEKSLNSIDIPFLNRDLGWETMKELFHHQVLDVSSIIRLAIDINKLPKSCSSGSLLAKHLGFGEVAHSIRRCDFDSRNLL